MSADYWADAKGRVTIEIRDYRNDRHWKKVTLELEPFAPVVIECLDGTDYPPEERKVGENSTMTK